jgi:penicillin-binding protein 1A
VEKLLDEAGRSAGKASSNEPPNPARPATSSALALPESFAAASDGAAAPSPRKN